MAIMIPPYLHADIQSNAEKKLFKIMEKDLKNNWQCLHSLGLAQHQKKIQGEIDFLLIGSSGIFCIEVKGGRVKREAGVWKFINRYGFENVKYEGPFEQASSAMYSLKKILQGKFKGINNILFGYGVAFPDIEFNVASPEWSQEIIYDKRYNKKTFSDYLNDLIIYWEKKTANKNHLTSGQVSEIVNYLRGDFELITPLSLKLDDIGEQQIKLTENQYKALDRLRNNKRILFQGTAGTGKTLLSIEKAKREAINSNKVLYLCYNKLLGEKIRKRFMDEKLEVEVNSIHSYFYQVIMKSSFKNQFISIIEENFDDANLYTKIYPEFFISALSETEQQFDYLILDEGQDLLNFEWIDALDKILKGGLELGRWAIFYDSNNQGEMYKNFDQMVVDYLKSCGAVEYLLDINCRNTKPICIQTSLISGFHVEDSLINEGEKVVYEFYESAADQQRKVTTAINVLIADGINPNHITILIPNNKNMENINKLKTSCSIEKLTVDNINNPEKNTVYYTTTQSFKGLENQIIFYVGVDNFEGEWINTVNYVAMTRAKTLLYLFLHESLKENVKEKSKEYLIRGALQK